MQATRTEGSGVHASAAAWEADGLPKPRRFRAIAAVSLGTMVASIDSGSANIALPTLARELHVAPSSAVLVVTIYQLILIMCVLPLSAVGDRIGHRTLYLIGQAGFVAATLLCFVVHSLPALVVVRAVQALGASATMAVNSAMIRQIYPQARLGRGMALNTVVAATSASFAPTLGGLILGVARWPWLFAVCIPLGFFSVLLGHRSLPEPRRSSEDYDIAAALMCAAMFGSGVAGLEGAVHGAGTVAAGTLLACAFAVGFVFVRREARQKRPILPVDLLRGRQIGLSSLASLTASIGSQMVMLTLPFRLQMAYGMKPAAAGLALAPWPMVTMIVAPLSGVVSDKARPGLLGSCGMAISVAGLLSLAWLPDDPGHFDLLWRIMLASLGFGLFYPPNARQVIYAAPLERAAAAGALTQTTRMSGQVLGSTAAAALLALGLGVGPAPGMLAAMLATVSGLCSLALLLSGGAARR